MSSQPPASIDRPVSTSVCARCGAGFRCGMVAGDAACWCAALPPLAELPVAADANTREAGKQPSQASCFCPACLKSLTNPTP